MKPEQKARKHIDNLLTAAGWQIQDYRSTNPGASFGIAVREFPLKTGLADYMLFINRKAVGVIEAKPEGTTLSGVAEQTAKYIAGVPKGILSVIDRPQFVYESTGVETFFRDLRDPEPRSRRLFAFHRPETLHELLSQKKTLRARLKEMPSLVKKGLRDCQIVALEGLEESFSSARPRALIQMASGGGKTYTAVTTSYRLIKFVNAERILFLVDRSNLGRQTRKEFQQYETPDGGRKFTELYNVQHLQSNTIDTVSKVCITTIQRLYSMLKGEQEYDPELEEQSMFDIADDRPKEVVYNPNIPIGTFDFIITDECHRSIYNLWRPVLEYFDAFIIGLTATPNMQTLGFFNQNLVSEYPHERAVADGVNVGYEVYRIKTGITESGSTVEAGFFVDKRDKLTRKTRWEQLDEDLTYSANQLDREKSKVRNAGPQRLLTDIISLIRFATGQSEVLEPFSETVEQKFSNWLSEQERLGRTFIPEQMEWLKMIKEHIKTSLSIDREDFEETPFNAKGGLYKVYQLFGNDLNNVLNELNEVLAA